MNMPRRLTGESESEYLRRKRRDDDDEDRRRRIRRDEDDAARRRSEQDTQNTINTAVTIAVISTLF
jgi:hypothetical protein